METYPYLDGTSLWILCISGCQTTDDGKTTLNLNPVIGLAGMAVDGDDRDDYEKFFKDDDCRCRKK